jgi:hypothetical protein
VASNIREYLLLTEDESRNRFELCSHLNCMIPRTSLLVKRSKPSQVTILAGLSNFKFTTFAIFHVIWKNFREYFLRSRRRAYYFLCLRIIGRFSWITFIICKEVATLSEVRDDPNLDKCKNALTIPSPPQQAPALGASAVSNVFLGAALPTI